MYLCMYACMYFVCIYIYIYIYIIIVIIVVILTITILLLLSIISMSYYIIYTPLYIYITYSIPHISSICPSKLRPHAGMVSQSLDVGATGATAASPKPEGSAWMGAAALS